MSFPEDPRTTDAERMRPKLLALAYRMLGSAVDAEDAVQDAYLHLQETAGVASPDAWLVKATTRLCIDRLRKAKRRAEYVGPWLPEPISDVWEGAATDRLELAESLSMAFLVLLESLSPAERAAYLLREVFDYEFEEIAALLNKTVVNVRQITARAKKRLGQRDRRFRPAVGLADALADRFFTACRSGDIEAIEALLSPEAVYYSDGGGNAPAAPKPVCGRRKIANLLSVVFRKRQRDCVLSPTAVNGQPGVVFVKEGKAVQVLTFAAEQGGVGALYSVLNPNKLQRWSADPNETAGPVSRNS